MVRDLDPVEYKAFLAQRKKDVRQRMFELEEAKAATILKVAVDKS